MVTLTSPGVSVTVTNESFYATAGTGTVPLIVIATAQNKFQPGSSTAIASGTVKSAAGKLTLVTSQREALQTFGLPTFYNVAGTPQFDNELNELGLFGLYEYLGIANSAFVIRADVDLAELAPSSTPPVGNPSNGSYWLDLSNTSWGVFKSNGDTNSAYTWESKVPAVISSKDDLESIVQGDIAEPVVSPTQGLISTNASIVINNVPVPLAANDSITAVVNKINSVPALNSNGITAIVYTRTGKYSLTGSTVYNGSIYGDMYNIRITSSNIDNPISLNGSNAQILADLGLPSGVTPNVVLPRSGLGVNGDFAVDAISTDSSGIKKNNIWQKIALTTNGGSASWWFKVGTTDAIYPNWGWREASPRVITGSVPNPVFTSGQSITYKINNTTGMVATTGTTLDSFISQLNTSFNSYSLNVVAKKVTSGNNNYLQIVNFDATDVYLHDNSDQSGDQHPLLDAGISTSQPYFGSVTGTVSKPVFVAPEMFVDSATTATSGTGYEVGDSLTVVGGNVTVDTPSTLTVSSITVVDADTQAAGSGYSVRDTITISGASYTTPVILRVETVSGSGAITGVSVLQAGQFNNPTTPTNPVTGTSSGSGLNASFNLTWGVGTVDVDNPGDYSEFPTSPATITGGSGTGATFNLVKGYTSSDVLSIDLGSGSPVEINVPGTSLDALIDAINAAFPSFTNAGLFVASKEVSGSNEYLKITNPNGTNFTLKDISGTPLITAGIKVGFVFGKKMIYQGYSPSLTVPNLIADQAMDNVWINTTAQNRGESIVLKQYQNGEWIKLNSVPNTGSIPIYSSTTVADSGFSTSKGIGSVFMLYNCDNSSPVVASQKLMVWNGSSWNELDYTPSLTAPTGAPVAGTYWYNTDLAVDIMVGTGQVWQGYRQAYPSTDPNGPILSGSRPTVQSDNTPLVDYDIWIDTSDIENYPMIYRYSVTSATWILIDNTDHSSAAGIIFADARATADGTKTGSTTPAAMTGSNYVDPDAPNAELYPRGLMLFNTRYSTNNVKVWTPNALPTAVYKDRWVTASGNKPDGTPYMGHWAQRNMIVQALKAAINANQDARAEQTYFNLLSCPGYTEAIGDLVSLNVDKKEIGFVIGDTPARLKPTGTSIQAWATNSAGASMDGPDGLVTRSQYAAVYYPWAKATNIDGTQVFVPPSVMALRTFAYNDQVAYPWFAPAGFNRGLVTGVESVGYLNEDNTYQFTQLSQGQRDVMYNNSINPVAFIPNRGLVIYGQKTLSSVSSALDRINVARLINYLNYQLDNLAKPFLFEPNDVQTRRAVTTSFTGFIGNLVGLRAIYDFAVVCDETNNDPARIDRNELWIDIAIKPEKSIEFIYIPIRLLNTGDPMPGAVSGNATA